MVLHTLLSSIAVLTHYVCVGNSQSASFRYDFKKERKKSSFKEAFDLVVLGVSAHSLTLDLVPCICRNINLFVYKMVHVLGFLSVGEFQLSITLLTELKLLPFCCWIEQR